MNYNIVTFVIPQFTNLNQNGCSQSYPLDRFTCNNFISPRNPLHSQILLKTVTKKNAIPVFIIISGYLLLLW